MHVRVTLETRGLLNNYIELKGNKRENPWNKERGRAFREGKVTTSSNERKIVKNEDAIEIVSLKMRDEFRFSNLGRISYELGHTLVINYFLIQKEIVKTSRYYSLNFSKCIIFSEKKRNEHKRRQKKYNRNGIVSKTALDRTAVFFRCRPTEFLQHRGNKKRGRIVSKQFRRGILRDPRLKGSKFPGYFARHTLGTRRYSRAKNYVTYPTIRELTLISFI